jgi:hypothetical protein
MKGKPLLLLLIACASTLQAQDYSYDQNSGFHGTETFTERVSLEITPIRTKILEERETVLPIVGALAAPLVSVGYAFVRSSIEKQAKQYLANYACTNSGDAFFETRQYANLPQLTIRRSITVSDRSGSSGVKSIDALVLVMEPELSSDKHAFRYRVKSINMSYSKARTKGRFDYIDVQLDMIFRCLATEAKKEVVTLRAFSFVIPSVKPNAPYDVASLPRSSWLPFPPAVQGTNGAGVYDKTGTYEFIINVTESNPYKIRADNKQVIVEKSSNGASSLAEEIAELIKSSNSKSNSK